MPANSLSPAFVKINYTSAYGNHVMTIPSVPVVANALSTPPYDFDLRGAALPVEVDGAVVDFVNVIKPFFPTSVNFVDATVYSQPLPTDVPSPVASFALGIAGTDTSASWSKAVQGTLTFRADDFTLFKLVWLDSSSFANYDKTTVVTGGSNLDAVVDYVTDPVTWIASRGGGRPTVFLQWTKTLNEKLRRSYNMT